MAEQILWVNTLIAVCSGLMLVIIPKPIATLLGLPHVDQRFYPRMLGITLIALAAAIVTEGYGREGLGIEGMAAINLISGGSLMLLLLFGGLTLAKRGRWLLRGLALLWLVLGGLGMIAGSRIA